MIKLPKKKSRKRKSPQPKRGRALNVMSLVLLAVIAAAVLLPLLQGGLQEADLPPDAAETMAVNFYFRDVNGDWQTETRQISQEGKQTDLIERILQGIVAGPRTTALQPAVPEGVYVEWAEIRIDLGGDETTVAVIFSESFGQMPPLEQVLTTISFVWTLTGLDFVDNLLFYTGDEEMLNASGNLFGLRNRGNTILEDGPPPREAETALVVLYFPNEAMTGLVAEWREITINPFSQDIERAKVAALIAGPRIPGLSGIFPAGTTYNRVEREGDIVIVDFTADFLTALSGGSLLEGMMIFSLVNTLTERPEVRRVQILIDGLPASHDDESELHIDLSRHIERDESWIETRN